MPQEFYLTGIKELLANVKSVLMYREITLKNNVIVLSLLFVHHTELQNFLIAPRTSSHYDQATSYEALVFLAKLKCKSILPVCIKYILCMT